MSALRLTQSDVSEITYDDDCADQDHCGVISSKASLSVTKHTSKRAEHLRHAVDETINDFDINDFPQTFARDGFNWRDDDFVVKLVNFVLVFQNLGHLFERIFAEDREAYTNANQTEQNRQACQSQFGCSVVMLFGGRSGSGWLLACGSAVTFTCCWRVCFGRSVRLDVSYCRFQKMLKMIRASQRSGDSDKTSDG